MEGCMTYADLESPNGNKYTSATSAAPAGSRSFATDTHLPQDYACIQYLNQHPGMPSMSSTISRAQNIQHVRIQFGGQQNHAPSTNPYTHRIKYSSSFYNPNQTVAAIQDNAVDDFEDVSESDITDDEETEESYQFARENRGFIYKDTHQTKSRDIQASPQEPQGKTSLNSTATKKSGENKPLKDAELGTITVTLLNFAKRVAKDLHSMFIRKNDPEACAIYDKHWAIGKTGRELYYMDLLRVAYGGDADAHSNKRSTRKSRQLNSQPHKESKEDIGDSGKHIPEKGLGPLEELFNRTTFVSNTYERMSSIGERITERSPSPKDTTPIKKDLRKRKLPDSFWVEPRLPCGGKQRCVGSHSETRTCEGAPPSISPDFSDLLESWGAAIASTF